MTRIAQLLLGPDGDRLLDLLTPVSNERRMTARVREAGEWCQSTPGADSLRAQRRGVLRRDGVAGHRAIDS